MLGRIGNLIATPRPLLATTGLVMLLLIAANAAWPQAAPPSSPSASAVGPGITTSAKDATSGAMAASRLRSAQIEHDAERHHPSGATKEPRP